MITIMIIIIVSIISSSSSSVMVITSSTICTIMQGSPRPLLKMHGFESDESFSSDP